MHRRTHATRQVRPAEQRPRRHSPLEAAARWKQQAGDPSAGWKDPSIETGSNVSEKVEGNAVSATPCDPCVWLALGIFASTTEMWLREGNRNPEISK